jgi:tRNA G18 (ribose-2'-O)-methylase SpoU
MKPTIVLIAHNIRSLWNVGSFFRSADCFGVEHIYLTGYTACPPRIEIAKTALGAQEWIPWSYERDPMVILLKLRTEGFHILALEKNERSRPLTSRSYGPRIALIVGNEITGVPNHLLSEADSIGEIPIVGRKESLNVAVACGIALAMLRREA